MTKLIVGLGNPGARYETTRHNAGFIALDWIIDAWKAFGPRNERDGELYEVTLGGTKVILVKPKTFMNVSGKCVGPLFTFFKCEPKDLIVIHDDVDLPSMSIKIKTGGGTGGHNGLKSLDQYLGSGNTGYHRIRIGVGKPSSGDGVPSEIGTADYVLSRFTDEELSSLEQLLGSVTDACALLIADKPAEAMNRYNGQSNDKKGN